MCVFVWGGTAWLFGPNWDTLTLCGSTCEGKKNERHLVGDADNHYVMFYSHNSGEPLDLYLKGSLNRIADL